MFKVVFEDNHLLAVEKPAGLLTQPSGTEQDSLEDQAKSWLREKYQKKGNIFLHAIHRLDKPVSGIVLFAKTSKALSRLQEEMRERRIQKTYCAEVEGIVAEDKKTLQHYLVHQDFHAKVYETPKKDADLAILTFQVLERRKNTTLLEIQLETGRYHQIRAQLAFIGYPIVGDGKYQGGSASNSINLHHTKLEFLHPITKETISICLKSSF